jgi:Arc/MetJ-type ribon-helix-helix transcriptional regulator
MAKAIDQILVQPGSPYRSRADFIRVAVEKLLAVSGAVAE